MNIRTALSPRFCCSLLQRPSRTARRLRRRMAARSLREVVSIGSS